MTTATMNRDNLWEVTSRTIVDSAIGAALYGILLVAQIPIPGSTVSVRPAFATARCHFSGSPQVFVRRTTAGSRPYSRCWRNM